MKFILFSVCLAWVNISSFAQSTLDTTRWKVLFTKNGKSILTPKLPKAESLKNAGLLPEAIKAYGNEYQLNPSNTNPLYEIARMYARMNMKTEAVYNLTRYMDSDSSLDMLSEPDLYLLSQDIRWNGWEETQLQKYIAKTKVNLSNKELTIQLLHLAMIDQTFNEDYAQWKLKRSEEGNQIADSLMKLRVEFLPEITKKLINIVTKHGWPTSKMVGERASLAAFQVMNSSHRNDQRTLLPYLETAMKKGEADPAFYAFVVDGILLEENNPQKYGTHVIFDLTAGNYIPRPIGDPEEVNTRRKAIGLESLEAYLKGWSAEFKMDKSLKSKINDTPTALQIMSNSASKKHKNHRN